LTLGITSLCLLRGFFFALANVATTDELFTDTLKWCRPRGAMGAVAEPVQP